VDVEMDTIKVFDTTDGYGNPLDCRGCYTLWFYLDSAFGVRQVMCGIGCNYAVNCTLSTINFATANCNITACGDIPDGELLRNIFLYKFGNLTPFELKGSELKLYYNDEKNYLLFNLIK